MDIVSLAEDIVKKAINRGAENTEVFIKTGKRLSVEAKNSSVEAIKSARDFGIALRVINKQRLGFAFATSPNDIKNMVDKAVEAARWTTEDEYIDIPEHQSVSDVLILDEELKDIKEEEVIKNALLLEKTALDFDARIKKVRKAEIILNVGEIVIFNSNGVKISYEGSKITTLVNVLASNGKDSQAGWDFSISRRLRDIDFISVAEGASKKAISLLGSRRITSVKAPVILDSAVAANFLGIFAASISAEAVQKKRSFLVDKIGKTVTNNIINIIDDGIMPWKVGTRPVDDEGVPMAKKVIVSQGILMGFIHNTYTAKRENISSTGNAIRGNFRNLPGIGVTNLYIEPAKKQNTERRTRKADFLKDNNLLQSVPKALLVLETMGMHTANPVSGDFSIGVSGLWIENGTPSYPVKEAVISGNILNLFNKIDRVGDDLRFYGNIGSPCLLIGDMDISA